jgi:[protein-PII] uridylyltransferase
METAVQASRLVRRVRRPDLLLLAAIFHDIGKGTGRDHSVAGAEMIRGWLERLGVSDPDIVTIETLVRHHLLLADTASRRDPEDPATIATISSVVPDLDTLQLLSALTEADSRAAGPKSWSTWKAAQVARLVARTASAIGAGSLRVAVPAVSAREAELLARAADGAVKVRVDTGLGGLTVTLAAPDRPGLLAAAAGTLTLHRLTIRGATARTVDGIALQVWTVQSQFGDAPEADTVRADLTRALDGGIDVTAALAKRDPARDRVPAPAPLLELLPAASAQATVLQVRAHDVPGLLHRITGALAGAGVTVTTALVDTLGSEVVDVFYLVGPDGAPLPESTAQRAVVAVGRALGVTPDNLA